jgi:hypothetical protein
MERPGALFRTKEIVDGLKFKYSARTFKLGRVLGEMDGLSGGVCWAGEALLPLECLVVLFAMR